MKRSIWFATLVLAFSLMATTAYASWWDGAASWWDAQGKGATEVSEYHGRFQRFDDDTSWWEGINPEIAIHGNRVIVPYDTGAYLTGPVDEGAFWGHAPARLEVDGVSYMVDTAGEANDWLTRSWTTKAQVRLRMHDRHINLQGTVYPRHDVAITSVEDGGGKGGLTVSGTLTPVHSSEEIVVRVQSSVFGVWVTRDKVKIAGAAQWSATGLKKPSGDYRVTAEVQQDDFNWSDNAEFEVD